MFLIFSFCNKMLRKIACYVIVITLIWGIFLIPQFQQAATENEEKIRNIFKSNMTRGDFSNLLKSLIRLNEQRVNVLQKLYRLDDYSVLSEVLRSGDNKKGNGNLSNLFLVVLSKNQSDPSRRSMGFQVVDSVSSLDMGSSNIGGTPINVSRNAKTKAGFQPNGGYRINNNKFELNLGDNAKRLRTKHIGDRTDDPNTTKQRSSHVKSREQETVTVKSIHKPQGRFEIVSNGRIVNPNEEATDVEGNNDDKGKPAASNQMRESPEVDITLENDRVTKLPDFDPTNSEEDKDSLSNENNPKNIFIPLTLQRPYEIHDNKHHKLNQDVSKEDNREKPNPNRDNQREKSSGNKDILSKNIPVPTNYGKKYPKHAKINPADKRPKINEQIPDNSNENAFYINKETKNDDDLSNKYSKINKDEANENIQANKYAKIISDTVDNLKKLSKITKEHSAENGHMISFNLKKPSNYKISKDDSKEDVQDSKYPPMSKTDEKIYSKFPKITKDRSNENDYHNSRPNDAKGSHRDKLIQEAKMGKDFPRHDFDATGIENYGGQSGGSSDKTSVVVREGPLTPFDENYEQPEAGRESRKTFQKCINKRAFKMCCKSCISAYKNVCRRLKCTSRSKRALKKECKRSCKQTFSSKSSKYSDESDDSDSR